MTHHLANTATATPDLASLLGQVRQLLSLLHGYPTRKQARVPEQEIASLYQSIAQKYPEAGKVYWSARTWQVWAWQSIYLNVMTTHLYGIALDTSGVVPHVQDDVASGFDIAQQAVVARGCDAALIDAQQACLKWIERYTPVVSRYGAFSEK